MIFEIIMLICFGAAWPVAVYKSYKSKSTTGKSILFSYIILLGYIAGIFHKIFYNFDYVTYLYVFNSFIILVDVFLFYKNKKPKNS